MTGGLSSRAKRGDLSFIPHNTTNSEIAAVAFALSQWPLNSISLVQKPESKRVSVTTNPIYLSYEGLFQAKLLGSVVKCLAAFANACFNAIRILENR